MSIIADSPLTINSTNGEGLNNEIREMELRISQFSEELTKDINESYGSITDQINDELGPFGAPLAFLTTLVGSIASINATIKRNKELKLLLQRKQKIAFSKIYSLIELHEKTADILEKKKELFIDPIKTKEYNPKLSKDKRDLIETLESYKTCLYNELKVKYLLAEFCAWIDGKQQSDMDFPTLYSVNMEIYRDFTHDHKFKHMCDVFYDKSYKLKESDICILTDPSLFAALLTAGQSYQDGRIANIKLFPINKICRRLLISNKSFRRYKIDIFKIAFLNRAIHYTLCTICVILLIYFEFKALSLLLINHIITKWVLLVIIYLVELFLFIIYIVFFESDVDEWKDKLIKKWELRHKTYAGYVDIIQPNLEKESVILTALGGIAATVISPIRSIFTIFKNDYPYKYL